MKRGDRRVGLAWAPSSDDMGDRLGVPYGGVGAEHSPELTLDAVVVAVTDGEPRILVVGGEDGAPGLPSGAVDDGDDTLELGVRRVIGAQTGLEIAYAEQLYTFGNRTRRGRESAGRSVSVAYLTLVADASDGAQWIDMYDLFPWEDHRAGMPEVVAESLLPALRAWSERDGLEATDRVELAFGSHWDGIRAVERYELLYEAGLVQERAVDEGRAVDRAVGTALRQDHRRVASVALSRLRGKLTYRPVVFELVGEAFTLLELQRAVEALAGVTLHKQNFRRLVERSGLVEPTGERSRGGSGRPAELFRYRREVVLERSRPGVGQPYR